MIQFLQFFYRSVPDGRFQPYGPSHLLFLIVCIGTVYAVGKLPKRYFPALRAVLFTLFFFDVLNRYGFYGFSGYSGLTESLPFYHCRFVVLMSLVYSVRPSKPLGSLIYYWGIMGGFSSLVYPVPDSFLWPHILLMLFFLYHTGIFSMAVMVRRDGNADWDLDKIREVTFLYNLFLIVLNYKLHANYGMLARPPMLEDFLMRFGPVVYTIFVLCLYDTFLRAIALVTAKGEEVIALVSKHSEG